MGWPKQVAPRIALWRKAIADAGKARYAADIVDEETIPLPRA